MPASWKTVRVFISSTFRDMQAERDHLVRFVFPRLREELLKRRIHLVDVDLRWGVTSEQDASEVCREIIDECRPRFLCILGGRYGWVPPGNNRSITADEVHYGVLDRTLQKRGFAYFYFRDESATVAMIEPAAGDFREPQGSVNQNKLMDLKRAIVAEKLNPFTYPAQWDNDSGRLTGLEKFGDRVYYDLLNSIDVEFGTASPEIIDEFAEEDAAMEAFIEERTEQFVLGSRESALNELLDHAKSTGGNGYVCLTGAPGSGKSALLAYLSRRPEFTSNTDTLLIPHFVGASPGSTDVRRTLRRLCHELKAGCPDITEEIPDDPERLRTAFASFLRQACAERRVVILLDAANQFDPASRSAGLHWLLEELPSNTRLTLSSDETHVRKSCLESFSISALAEVKRQF